VVKDGRAGLLAAPVDGGPQYKRCSHLALSGNFHSRRSLSRSMYRGETYRVWTRPRSALIHKAQVTWPSPTVKKVWHNSWLLVSPPCPLLSLSLSAKAVDPHEAIGEGVLKSAILRWMGTCELGHRGLPSRTSGRTAPVKDDPLP
jgi:hypothetical protein